MAENPKVQKSRRLCAHTYTQIQALLVSPEYAGATGNVEGITSSDSHSNGELCSVRTDELRLSLSACNLTTLKGVLKNLVMLDRMQTNYKFIILLFMHQSVKC